MAVAYTCVVNMYVYSGSMQFYYFSCTITLLPCTSLKMTSPWMHSLILMHACKWSLPAHTCANVSIIPLLSIFTLLFQCIPGAKIWGFYGTPRASLRYLFMLQNCLKQLSCTTDAPVVDPEFAGKKVEDQSKQGKEAAIIAVLYTKNILSPYSFTTKWTLWLSYWLLYYSIAINNILCVYAIFMVTVGQWTIPKKI